MAVETGIEYCLTISPHVMHCNPLPLHLHVTLPQAWLYLYISLNEAIDDSSTIITIRKLVTNQWVSLSLLSRVKLEITEGSRVLKPSN